MAWKEFDKISQVWRVRFRIPNNKTKYRVEQGFQDEDAASALCNEVEETIRLIKGGRIQVPPNADLGFHRFLKYPMVA